MILQSLYALTFFAYLCHGLYSSNYQRCRIQHQKIDPDALPIEDLEVQRIPLYYTQHHYPPTVTPELELEYRDFNYFYTEYLDAGGSGEVYLVEEEDTGIGKVVKRYFKEKPMEFRRENYIMKKLNHSIEWAKDCGDHKCEPDEAEFSTMAIFPSKESIVLRKLEFDDHEAPIIFYKILKELVKTHKAGIIHNDLKMGNILVNSVGPNFKFYQIQLIDWNLASFYHTGVDISTKRGTVCYYSPEQLFSTYHITPAIDVWALGVVMYTFYTDSKPFGINCKSNNLKAIANLVGGKKLLDMYKKYRYNHIGSLDLLMDLEEQPEKYPPKELKEIKVEGLHAQQNKQLREVFWRMFEPDPELRATPEELMKMPYFRRIKQLPEMYSMKEQRKKEEALEKMSQKKTH